MLALETKRYKKAFKFKTTLPGFKSNLDFKNSDPVNKKVEKLTWKECKLPKTPVSMPHFGKARPTKSPNPGRRALAPPLSSLITARDRR